LIEAGGNVAFERRYGTLARSIAATDFVRRSPFAVGGRGGHKEWQHFAILSKEVDLLVNFSLCDDTRSEARPGAEVPRLVLLARTGTWDGDIETYSIKDARVTPGAIELEFGESRLTFRDGVFEIDARLGERPMAVHLRLTPVTMPAFVPSIPMLDGPPLHWVVVPRLAVEGTLLCNDRTHVLDGALAYHDHNWGHFQWGHDVAWEWGFVLPDDARVPWSVTFVRLTNRARTVALAHKMLVWRGADLARVFREREVEHESDLTHLSLSRLFKVPRPLALVAPERLTDVPLAVETRAEAEGEWVTCRCEPFDDAQVLIPSDTELGVTIFNEVSGRIGGEDLSFWCRSIMEFIRYA
jgi:hypothetical protein